MSLAHNQNDDPTQTKTLRRQYAQRLRGQLRDLRTEITQGIEQEDIFGLSTNQAPTFRFMTDDRKAEEFMDWLRRQERRGILSVISRGDNTFVRSAYSRGVTHADAALNQEGVTVPETEIQSALNRPIHASALQVLYTRNYSELQGITDAMNQQISRELTDGFSRGLSATRIGRNVSEVVDDVGLKRSTMLARTEVVNAYSEGTLNRFERLGVDEIEIQAEWATAGDLRVCPICRALEGNTYTVEEARNGTFEFNDSEYPLKPPAHPNCRCAILPSL